MLALRVSSEVRRRIELVLSNGNLKSLRLRNCRAIEILERTRTCEAIRLLKNLSEGDKGSYLSVEARNSLDRILRIEKSTNEAR